MSHWRGWIYFNEIYLGIISSLSLCPTVFKIFSINFCEWQGVSPHLSTSNQKRYLLIFFKNLNILGKADLASPSFSQSWHISAPGELGPIEHLKKNVRKKEKFELAQKPLLIDHSEESVLSLLLIQYTQVNLIPRCFLSSMSSIGRRTGI